MSKNFGQILSQAKKIQEKLQKMQEEMGDKTIEAQSGGGMVSCVVNGRQELLSIKISEEIWEEKDKELLEDLIVAAINEGLNKSKEMMQEEMAKIVRGEDSFVLRECVTCYGCEEYCPMGNHPFYLIVERQEALGIPPVPRPPTTTRPRCCVAPLRQWSRT